MRKYMYGYLVNEDALLALGLQMALGTAEDEPAKRMTIMQAVTYIMCEGGVYERAKWVGVDIKGENRQCITLASSDPRDFLLVPPPEVIENFKKALRLEKSPGGTDIDGAGGLAHLYAQLYSYLGYIFPDEDIPEYQLVTVPMCTDCRLPSTLNPHL